MIISGGTWITTRIRIMKMIKFSFLKRRNNVNREVSVALYILTSAAPVFLAIITMAVAMECFNDSSFHYNSDYTLKALKLITASIFFSVIYSVVDFYIDKSKVKKIINIYRSEYNKGNYNQILTLISDKDDESVNYLLEEIEKGRVNDGELRCLDIHAISFIVTGINMKKLEYNISCISMYASERSEIIYFNCYTINSGDLILKSIDYPVDVRQDSMSDASGVRDR